MNTEKLLLNVAKLITLSIILIVGIPYVVDGYRLSHERPSPEVPITFEAEMQPKAGPLVGNVKIHLVPTEAFVAGDRIRADIEVHVYWLHENETASVDITFVDCLSIDFQWAWTNTSHFNMPILLKYNSSRAVYSIYRGRAMVWYTHEGIYGVNVTVYSPYSQRLMLDCGTLDGTVDWSFPEVVHMKSYIYLEQRLSAQFANALTLEILGLTIIASSPIAVMIVDLVGKVLESLLEEKEGKERKTAHWALYE